MRRFFRSGEWVSVARARRFSVLFIAVGLIAILAVLLTSDGMVDSFGRPLGTDFSNVHTAGLMILEGDANRAYVPEAQLRVQQEFFDDPEIPFYAWHYPPYFLIVAAALALLPYTFSWLTWMGVTLPLYMFAAKRVINQKTALLASLGFPAVLINFLHGQNAFLTAALLCGAMLCLRPKPILAGILIALLAYKPQFGLLLPIILLAGGFYRTFFAATGALICLSLFVTLVFGPSIWESFLESRHFSRSVILEAGTTGWYKIQTAFSAVRMWGGPVPLAYSVQTLLALSVIILSIWIWRGRADFDLKAASLIAGSLLMTPYMLDYDMVTMAPAMLLVVRFGLRVGWLPYERSALALIWIAPVLARPAVQLLALPVGFLSILALFLLIVHKARTQTQPEPVFV
ncbi:MAG: glycosyltransferase family 87 protein [Pseudomonadota bacterium]